MLCAFGLAHQQGFATFVSLSTFCFIFCLYTFFFPLLLNCIVAFFTQKEQSYNFCLRMSSRVRGELFGHARVSHVSAF